MTDAIPPLRSGAYEIDVAGLTDPGRVRGRNEDQFLVASLHQMLRVHAASAPPEALGELTSDSRAYVFAVADGVGGRPDGDVASWTAVQEIADQVVRSMRVHVARENAGKMLGMLQRAVQAGHARIRAEAAGNATTFTMVVVAWPRAYLIHVGDSRCYRMRAGVLEQLSTDQTMAAALVEAGVLDADQAESSQWKHVLASALGGDEATPLCVPAEAQLGDKLLLCTDGLTKHVSDEEIAGVLRSAGSATAACRALVDLANERGGTDNVTVVAGCLRKRQPD
jgi:serine/threonine protein phosphatase PrpC